VLAINYTLLKFLIKENKNLNSYLSKRISRSKSVTGKMKMSFYGREKCRFHIKINII